MKNLLQGIRKFPLLLLTFIFAGNTFLCSCNLLKPASPEAFIEEPAVEETEIEEIEEFVSEPEEIIEEPEEIVLTWRDQIPYEEITLDGEKDHHYVADDYCYIESEKYVVFLEKDIDIPGDFITNVDAIIDELETELNVSSAPSDYTYYDVCDMTAYYGFNPWKDINIGTKIPIFLIADEEDECLISCACGDFLVLVDYAMFSEDMWNSVPGYYDSDFRTRPEYVDYSTIAHEMTHTITERNHEMSMIMTEGIADYMSREIVDALADEYPSIAEAKENTYLYDNSIPEKVNGKNAERIFIADYNEIDHAQRGAEYTFGRYLCQYLDETYGDNFYSDYNAEIKKDNIIYSYGNYDEEIITKYADALKEVFGEDVFSNFGSWCVKNNALQELGGVFPD